jgi:nicotianamine synthase
VLAAHHLPNTQFDNYDMCGPANERAQKLFRADGDLRTRMNFHTADVATLTDVLGKYDVVFLAVLVGMAAVEKAKVVAHLGRHMADGVALVVRSAHGARGFLYPIVDPQDTRRGGFDVLTVYHPEARGNHLSSSRVRLMPTRMESGGMTTIRIVHVEEMRSVSFLV